MNEPTLYLMVGYPGAGKTTVSKHIHELTGAVHLWADKIRRERFKNPSHTHEENMKLYEHLNELAGELLATGQSVVFDTNFNYYKDRKHLREIARKHGAKTLIIWLTTSKNLAKQRATDGAHLSDTRILGNMPKDRFEKIIRHLEAPRKDEEHVSLVGEDVTKETVRKLLGLS